MTLDTIFEEKKPRKPGVVNHPGCLGCLRPCTFGDRQVIAEWLLPYVSKGLLVCNDSKNGFTDKHREVRTKFRYQRKYS